MGFKGVAIFPFPVQRWPGIHGEIMLGDGDIVGGKSIVLPFFDVDALPRQVLARHDDASWGDIRF